jgi:hypothetical protein
MTVYGRQNGRGMAHILAEVLDNDRGLAACGAPILSIAATAVPAGTVCRTCVSVANDIMTERSQVVLYRPDLQVPSGRGLHRIGLPQASRECGLALSSLQQAARLGRLQTEQPSPKVRLTTRRWLRDYLDSRPDRFKRRQAVASKP